MPEMSTATHINRAEIAGRIEAMELLKKDLLEFAFISRYDDKKDIDVTEWSPESLMARLWKAVKQCIKDREIDDPEFWYNYLTVLFEGFPVELPLCAIDDAMGLSRRQRAKLYNNIVRKWKDIISDSHFKEWKSKRQIEALLGGDDPSFFEGETEFTEACGSSTSKGVATAATAFLTNAGTQRPSLPANTEEVGDVWEFVGEVTADSSSAGSVWALFREWEEVTIPPEGDARGTEGDA